MDSAEFFDETTLFFLIKESDKNNNIECYIDGQLVPYVVIDGLDEIHPDTATELLNVVTSIVTVQSYHLSFKQF